MATAISRPNFGPLEDNIIVCVKKAGDYPVNQPINVDSDGMLFFYQNGEYVGEKEVYAQFKTAVLNKKNINSNGKKLSKGLFAKEYKNVAIFWLLRYTEELRFSDTVTTKKGFEGKYGLYLKMDLMQIDHEKFTKMLRETKIGTDKDQIIITKDVVRDIAKDRINGAMETILDDCHGHIYNAAKLPSLAIHNSLCSYLRSELSKIGLDGNYHISGLPTVM